MQSISTALDHTEKPDVAGSSSLMSAGSGLSLDETAPTGPTVGHYTDNLPETETSQ